ncbi:MAG TPA: hypothetical protein VJX66_14490 [Amycolatopsis sp.]|nr:hypothetical protein [Amycolatopsis sp.]
MTNKYVVIFPTVLLSLVLGCRNEAPTGGTSVSVQAATPASATLSPSTPTVSWSGEFMTPTAGGCGSDHNPACDNFKLTFVPPAAGTGPYAVRITLQPNIGDWDLEVYGPDGAFINGDGNSAGVLETVILPNNPAGGTYTVTAVPFSPTPNSPSYTAAAELIQAPPRPVPAPAATGLPPRYQNHNPTPAQIAAGMGVGSGEPSIGVNWKTGKVMYEGGIVQTLRVGFDDRVCPATPSSTWEDKTAPTSATSFDPILFTDSKTGRTFVSQLIIRGSLSSFTDTDGDVWIPSQGAGIDATEDHQTIGGGGPFHAPIPTGATYPNPVYYCAQHILVAEANTLGAANCALSIDGGLTYGPAMTAYTPTQCGGLHGHVKVGPDGTAYLPNKDCNGKQAVVVSQDNGITWTVRPVPGSAAGDSDPSVAIGAGGRVYLAYAHADSFPVVAVSDDFGATWHNVYDVGAAAGINNVVFPAVVAGDNDRAAFAFFGTPAMGNLQSANFPGVWHLYVAHTFDGGASWVTVDATPNDAVQRGCVWLQGGSNICRNLLDFMDATVDKEGRVLVGYPDGCTGTCSQAGVAASGNGYTALAAIARQTGGRRLFHQFDPVDPTAPGSPSLTVTRNGSVAHLTWSESENGGSAITNYRVLRGTTSGAETLLANAGTATRFDDATIDASKTYYYQVTATNAVGTSCGATEVAAQPLGSSCSPPGLRVVTDTTGDQVGAPANAALDVQSISVAEPFFADGSQKLVFTLKVANLATVPANAQWRIFWNSPSAPNGIYYVGMTSDDGANVTFEYGTAVVQVVGLVLGVPVTTKVGAPDDGRFSADGSIAITVSNDKVGTPKAGDLLGAMFARTFLVTGNTTTRSTTAIDQTGAGDAYALVGNGFCAPPVITCLEDDDTRIAYGNGWHRITDPDASGGHFRMTASKSSATLAFTVPGGKSGAVTYKYATSPKGGSAQIYLDGVLQGTVNYSGTAGTTRAPVFGPSTRLGGLRAGDHTLEIRPTSGVVYVDGFCLESSSSNAQPSAGPGTTTTSSSTLAVGQQALLPVVVPAGGQALSIVTEPGSGVPIQIALIDPAGSVLTTADASTGLAVIDTSVSKSGTYVVKVVNVGLGPVDVWTVATPLVAR